MLFLFHVAPGTFVLKNKKGDRVGDVRCLSVGRYRMVTRSGGRYFKSIKDVLSVPNISTP